MQKKKGISLIVLVITIIVMIILAAAIILSLNNAGIIGNANKAVESTDEATVKQLAQMAWAEAYVDGVRKVEDEGSKKGFKTRVTEALTDNKIDTTKYFFNVTEKGVTVKLLAEAWIQDGLTVKRKNDVLRIGQTVNYNADGTDYEGKEWKVLGADADGNLLIMSAEDVKTEYQLGSTDLTETQKEWLSTGIIKLNNVCSVYGKGAGAISARSITVEDVNKVTGYKPEIAGYGKGELYEYGNKVTYYYNASINPSYTSTVTGETPVNLSTDHTNGFFWHDKSGLQKVTVEELKSEVNTGKSMTTIINNVYWYYGTTLSVSSTGTVNGLSMDSEAYKMIFGISDSYNSYWLANSYIYTDPRYIGFGIFDVLDGMVIGNALWRSTGITYAPKRGVRAVVTISSDIPMASLVQ